MWLIKMEYSQVDCFDDSVQVHIETEQSLEIEQVKPVQ